MNDCIAIAIKVDGRFFNGYQNKRKQVATARSLAGAKLFLRDHHDALPRYFNEIARIRRIRPKATISIVSIRTGTEQKVSFCSRWITVSERGATA